MDTQNKRNPLHLEDLHVAEKALIQLRNNYATLVEQARSPRHGCLTVSFWNEEKWLWHNDVPPERMYVCNFSSDSIERLDAFIEWLERQVELLTTAEGVHQGFLKAEEEVRQGAMLLDGANVPSPQAPKKKERKGWFSSLFGM